MALLTTNKYVSRILKNLVLFEFESRLTMIKSLDPCIIPKVKIKINPKNSSYVTPDHSSKLSGKSDVIHSPTKLDTIEKL